jgi:hypothetical protein
MRVRLYFAATIVSSAMSCMVHAEPLPRFEDCLVAVQSKPASAPRLKFADAQGKKYKTVIRDAASEPVNFAGHYVLTTWGCGAGCVMAAAIDTQSGRVTSLPFTTSDWPTNVTEPLAWRANSCLLVVRGSRNEGSEHGTYYYAFDGKTFKLRANVSDPMR